MPAVYNGARQPLLGVHETRDCAAAGQSCGYVDDRIGWFCR